MSKADPKQLCRCGHPLKKHWTAKGTRNEFGWVERETMHFCDGKPRDTLTDMCRCMKFRARKPLAQSDKGRKP